MPQYQNAYKNQGIIFKKRPAYNVMPNRSIITNQPDFKVCDNSIKTSKYTFYNFLPLNLIVQFSKVPNIYFLIIGIMQMIPSISISGGFPVIFIPLSIVVGVSAFKDFYQDLKRKISDAQINNKKAHKLTENGFQQVKWAQLRIGDVIKVFKNQYFPADLILLQSSQQKLNCFIETMNLDGQTNLKYKQVKFELGSILRQFKGHLQSVFFQNHQQFKYQRPNPFIHTFTGSWNNIPLDNNNVILRGCSLKITQWVTGCIVYTGVDTKIMLNSNKTRQKKSRLQFKMGIIVATIFLIQMAITLLSSLISVFTMYQFDIKMIFGWEYYNFIHRLFVKWGSWILLFTNFVPISLIVSLQMVKYIQGMNISQSRFSTTNPAQVIVQTSSLNQELGQVQHLFSDKTGTLTKNHMNFKYMSIGSQTFGYDSHNKLQIPKQITNVDFHDQKFMKIVKSKRSQQLLQLQNKQIYDMMIMFALCHNVIIEKDQKTGQQRYNASSPDQLAFINMAKYANFQYKGVNENNQLCIKRKFNNSQEIIKYKILHLIQFNSDRKRMTVILQKQNRVFVFCKGADNIIFQRIKNKQSKCAKIVKQEIQSWSVEGLRTLLFAKRQIKKEDYEKWAKMYAYSLSKLQKVQKSETQKLKKQFLTKLSIQEQQNSQKNDFNFQTMSKIIIQDQSNSQKIYHESPEVIMNKLINDNSVLTQKQKIFIDRYLNKLDSSTSCTSAQLEDILQKQLTLIGSTAIQDRLQDNVKQTIQKLRQAGIKVWMLTGDKKQTAVNIGKSCGLIQQDMAIIYWKNNSVKQTLQQRLSYPENRQCCLVATGNDLLVQMDQKVLLSLVEKCKSIICCRVTPKQKQDMVWLMRKNKCTTLGIGDGANDVNMINTAHVGVGIKGVQGAQAALCSDYAISQFQILGQLMLYHGRQAYRKNSQLILFNFYKNLLLVLPQFWFGFQNNFSSATIYDPWVYQLYNVVFTSFPIIVYAIYDQQFSVKQSIRNPKLYKTGLNNQLFNLKSVLRWFIQPLAFSMILGTFNYIILQGTLTSRGYLFDMLSTGMCIFAQCVIINNLKVLILSYTQSIGLYLVCFLSIGFYYFSVFAAQKIFKYGDLVNSLSNSFSTLGYWACIFSNVSLVIIYQKIKKALSNTQQMEVKIKFKEQEQIQMPILNSKQLSQF